MTCYSPISTDDAIRHTSTEHAAYMAAYAKAAQRARFSYFDQHIILGDEGYWVADEGDYESLMPELVDRIVHTVNAGRSDES